MAVGKKVRFEVFKRDGFTCVYCGRNPPTVILQCDHVIAVSKGGGDEIENLATSCEDCNSGKSNRDLASVPMALAEMMEKRRERAEQLQFYNEYLMELRNQHDAAIERVGIYWFNQFADKKDVTVFGPSRIPSIRRFLEHIPEAEMLDYIDVAMMKKPPVRNDDMTFRYFCGICWKVIRPEGGVK